MYEHIYIRLLFVSRLIDLIVSTIVHYDMRGLYNRIRFHLYVLKQDNVVSGILAGSPSYENKHSRTLCKYFGSVEEQLVDKVMTRVRELLGPDLDGVESSSSSQRIARGCLYVLECPALARAVTREHAAVISEASVYASATLCDHALRDIWNRILNLHKESSYS